ncbi:hypothetical protein HanHA300_Chr16g0623271 [Helianthus annuus]|nr:hypothetical protein HanHA300_Chr16g0623271 [Helianthus annuus]KAJ0461597.1 hypothetical protein HanHA89_Chr16g0674111 [Helianthus annuus]KAJ0645892.1 hypothetical protein HanOQP8_Chr16g0629041 [Helianthus annuus]
MVFLMRNFITKYNQVCGFGELNYKVCIFIILQDMITDIAKKWSKVARTGGIEVKFMGVDVSTIMFTLEKGQDTLELKEFILGQPEAYEIKIGDQLFRRPGDPSFDDVFAELHANDYNDKNKNEGRTHLSNDDIKKDEL